MSVLRALLFTAALAGTAGASSPATKAAELLVGNKSADTVWRLSLRDGRRIGEFRTGEAPHEIAVAPDGRSADQASTRTKNSTWSASAAASPRPA